jgi:hypothetical protein
VVLKDSIKRPARLFDRRKKRGPFLGGSLTIIVTVSAGAVNKKIAVGKYEGDMALEPDGLFGLSGR